MGFYTMFIVILNLQIWKNGWYILFYKFERTQVSMI